jgi:hypothetical protein
MSDPDELEIWCSECNAKLWSDYRGNYPAATGKQHAIPCPRREKCKAEADMERARR